MSEIPLPKINNMIKGKTTSIIFIIIYNKYIISKEYILSIIGIDNQ